MYQERQVNKSLTPLSHRTYMAELKPNSNKVELALREKRSRLKNSEGKMEGLQSRELLAEADKLLKEPINLKSKEFRRFGIETDKYYQQTKKWSNMHGLDQEREVRSHNLKMRLIKSYQASPKQLFRNARKHIQMTQDAPVNDYGLPPTNPKKMSVASISQSMVENDKTALKMDDNMTKRSSLGFKTTSVNSSMVFPGKMLQP